MEYPMIAKHLRLSLSKGAVALVLTERKLKKIRLTHKRLVEAHENQRLTWFDVPYYQKINANETMERGIGPRLDLKCLYKEKVLNQNVLSNCFVFETA